MLDLAGPTVAMRFPLRKVRRGFLRGKRAIGGIGRGGHCAYGLFAKPKAPRRSAGCGLGSRGGWAAENGGAGRL